MRAIGNRDTTPELVVRSLLHSLGYRFRTQVRLGRSRPDIAFVGRKKAIFVHGCFWHGHPGCRFAYEPEARPEFWRNKIDGNRTRDRRVLDALAVDGWSTLVVWECETGNRELLTESLIRFLGPTRIS